jgi:hypothetical protein
MSLVRRVGMRAANGGCRAPGVCSHSRYRCGTLPNCSKNRAAYNETGAHFSQALQRWNHPDRPDSVSHGIRSTDPGIAYLGQRVCGEDFERVALAQRSDLTRPAVNNRQPVEMAAVLGHQRRDETRLPPRHEIVDSVESTHARKQRVNQPELAAAPRDLVGVDRTGIDGMAREIAGVMGSRWIDEACDLRRVAELRNRRRLLTLMEKPGSFGHPILPSLGAA